MQQYQVRFNFPVGVPPFMHEEASAALPRPGTLAFHQERTEVTVTVDARTVVGAVIAGNKIVDEFQSRFFLGAHANAVEAATSAEATNQLQRRQPTAG